MSSLRFAGSPFRPQPAHIRSYAVLPQPDGGTYLHCAGHFNPRSFRCDKEETKREKLWTLARQFGDHE
jgi:hypothetical protein